MKLSPEQKLAAGFGLGLALLLIITALAYFSTSELLDNNRRVSHTYQVLGQLQITLSLVQDAETGQRGYLITGDRQYLEPYNAALPQIDARLRQIGTLTADNPSQQQRLSRLTTVI